MVGSYAESDMDGTQYCGIPDVVDRLLIKSVDVTNLTTSLNYAIVEASRLVDTFLFPYVTSLPFATQPPDQIIIATADFAASVFKRRYTPSEARTRGSLQPDMINDVDGTGWFALGLKKVQEFIKDYYALKSQVPQTGDIFFNPEVFKGLFARGLLTAQEARKYMADTNATIQTKINEIMTSTKTVSLTETDIINKTETLSKSDTTTLSQTDTISKTITELKYPTKKQNSFGFIAGADNDEYTNQGAYVLDSAPNEGGE